MELQNVSASKSRNLSSGSSENSHCKMGRGPARHGSRPVQPVTMRIDDTLTVLSLEPKRMVTKTPSQVTESTA